ncbi:hypothetical protein K9U39_01350 [Rhodoblastus acidophilus]|uniref:Uncharacterized protein n=1 Tax=Candidatus Rhodoblastus alkanivorans TaxID=2954117 RepID=A0ABS9Z6N3_9HYPH|nr:hypothetical protein [Candidatus Rhodoblastus alkanivorans]MCI4680858.1 hypothetical protein [Candidatus Rhodoblastus alkanivorans]MCI4682297.1 hypothetical protein [Candidatus Rhodoblastus alkanivorans]MDI4639599.1 hypothetical protein [Rhodoblastus acidophilus]
MNANIRCIPRPDNTLRELQSAIWKENPVKEKGETKALSASRLLGPLSRRLAMVRCGRRRRFGGEVAGSAR